MRAAIVVLALLAAACGQSASQQPATPDQGAYAGSSGAGRTEAARFTLEPNALVGLWSFSRDCGLYDLVFEPEAATYYDYSDASAVVTHKGTWAAADSNRVVLTTHRLGPDGAPTGDAETYNIDVSDPVTDDLIGHFARADGSEPRDLTAKRCPDEDRD